MAMTDKPDGKRWGRWLARLCATVSLPAAYVSADFLLTTDFQVHCGLYVDINERHFHSYGFQVVFRPLAWIEPRIGEDMLIISSDGKVPSDFYDGFTPRFKRR